MKFAAKIQDADIQSLLAERKGEEYLQGGKLPSNDYEAPFTRKTAFDMSTQAGLAAVDAHNMTSKKKKHNKYQTLRDYSGAALKGGLTGIGLLGASNMMRGRFGPPSNVTNAARSARNWFAGGAAVSVADRAYRHNDLPGASKTAALGNMASPATQLSIARQTGGMKARTVPGGAFTPPKVLQLGKKFTRPF